MKQVASSSHHVFLYKMIARLENIVYTVDRTIKFLNGETKMKDQEYYGGFSKEQQHKYEGEIRQKCGNTAIDESKKRMNNWSKSDFNRVMEDGTTIFSAIRANMDKGENSTEVQTQLKGLHQWLNTFYTCNLETLEEIGHMYNEHPDFRKMWQTKYHQDMPEFLQRSIEYYCHHNQS